MLEEQTIQVKFQDLNLPTEILKSLNDVGYETPSPIQAQTIPHLMDGKDLIGQAQTGTGKTAAFAIPILSKVNIKKIEPQALILTPTRELAIQVSEAFQRYASHLKNFHVLPVYGGQGYEGQLKRLRRGVHVVVGTPGRLIDHLKRGTLVLDSLTHFVLDEGDEMLRMGFLDDVEWILEHMPKNRQTALFSATMPKEIRRIAQKYLTNPVEITITAKTATVDKTRQRYWLVSGYHKLDALTRILEAEDFDGIIIFVRTKNATLQLAEKLEARGYAAAAINGDMVQNQRERTINQLKKGQINILVATDVAARGLDVDRISHVINYDIPYDTEAYVHRIGRTGRAGREGEAILFVAPREKRMLREIESATNQRIELMKLPSTEMINNQRIAKFKQQISDTLAEGELSFYTNLIEKYSEDHNISPFEVAGALAKMAQGDTPLLLQKLDRNPLPKETDGQFRPRRKKHSGEKGMISYRIAAGKIHDVQPRNIVGAIANEIGLDSKHIGRISIFDDYSVVDLPEGIPNELLKVLKNVWVAGQRMQLRENSERPPAFAPKGQKKARKKKAKKKV